ncbi:MAG: radical SAM protein, partial [Candidatus Bathyarchaeia archaeon]
MKIIKSTKSICPECKRVLEATIFEEDGRVYMKKECPEHGSFQDVYWSDYEQYKRAEEFEYMGSGIQNP